VEKISDPVIKSFWINEFARYNQKYETEATAAIQNKVGQFISVRLIRNSIGQVNSSIDMREVMDKRKILIMNLSKGKIGEDNSTLLGALLITKIQLAAMSRVDIPEKERQDFFLYVDEFQNFATESFVNVLSEARKYRLSLILAHQYITQMEETMRDAVFGNVGTLVSFRVGAADAEFLEKEFQPEFFVQDIVNLAKYHIYLKLMIDGLAGRPFSARTLPPFPAPKTSSKEKIIKVSREKYGTPRQKVEEAIKKWTGFLEVKPAFSAQEKTAVLYDAVCSLCKKPTKVVLQPDNKRPVYCKACLKKIKEPAESSPNNQTTKEPPPPDNSPEDKNQSVSLDKVIKKQPVLFEKHKRTPRREKKERKKVDLEELKKTLKESLGKLR
jgi:CxxC-x17-CxxC domain-containing protein